tara:strand:+ start:4959 stop:5366 length:408 start_codon:yes stop_codon:yes gene_type:complete
VHSRKCLDKEKIMLSTVLPLTLGTNGYAGFYDDETKKAINQNFRMLLMTRPGEYVMDNNFGIGLKNYLFELNTSFPTSEVESRVRSQVTEYMPYISIRGVTFDDSSIDQNSLGIRIEYIIMESVLAEILELTVTL